jgi:hypothetical protein
MSRQPRLTRTGTDPPERLSWMVICEHYPDEWVLLADIEEDNAKAIASARVLDHDESMIDIMDRNESLPGTTLIQTAGRPLWWLTRPRLIIDRDEEVPGLAPGATFTVGKRRR